MLFDSANHPSGMSHVEAFGYPVWGDTPSKDIPAHKIQSYVVWVEGDHPKDIIHLDVAGDLKWDKQREYAESKGGRLLALEEAREFIKNVYKDEILVKGDFWVAVYGKFGEKDWMSIGDPSWNYPGKSHNLDYGLTAWGDVDAQPQHRKFVMYKEGQSKPPAPLRIRVIKPGGTGLNWQ